MVSSPSFHCASSTSFIVVSRKARTCGSSLFRPVQVHDIHRDRPEQRQRILRLADFVPARAVARAGAGDGAVNHAALQRGIDFGETDRGRLRADRGNEGVRRAAAGARMRLPLRSARLATLSRQKKTWAAKGYIATMRRIEALAAPCSTQAAAPAKPCAPGRPTGSVPRGRPCRASALRRRRCSTGPRRYRPGPSARDG